MALSQAEKQAFFDRGVVRLPRAFSEIDAAQMVNSIWNLLESRDGLQRNNPSTWPEMQPTGFQPLTRRGAFNQIASPVVIDSLNDLLGAGEWTSTKPWGVPLVTFPVHGRAWDVPHSQWHLDFPARGETTHLPEYDYWPSFLRWNPAVAAQ